MLVYISIDLEGVAGVATLDQIIRGGHGYPRAQRLMTAEANAAVAGAFDAGAEGVVVNDSHGTMDNLLHDELDPRARVVVGAPKPDGMAEGLSPDFGVALLVGYHAAGGRPGVLAHTYSGVFAEVRLNGSVVSEAELTAQQAAAVGVPVGLVTGDDVICGLAEATFPGATTVVVKTALGHTAADSLAPSRACSEIRAAAALAVTSAVGLRPIDVPDDLDVEIDLLTIVAAERAVLLPGIERTGIRTVRCRLARPRETVGLLDGLCSLLTAPA
jgi:D-amino peptidase